MFLGAVFGTPNPVNLLGQAGRQVMFIGVSIFGWVQWSRSRGAGQGRRLPHWASTRARIGLGVGLIAGTLILTPIFSRPGFVRAGLGRRLDLHRITAGHLRYGEGLDRILADLGEVLN